MVDSPVAEAVVAQLPQSVDEQGEDEDDYEYPVLPIASPIVIHGSQPETLDAPTSHIS